MEANGKRHKICSTPKCIGRKEIQNWTGTNKCTCIYNSPVLVIEVILDRVTSSSVSRVRGCESGKESKKDTDIIWYHFSVVFSTLPLWFFETLFVNPKETNQQVGQQSLFIPYMIHTALPSAPVVYILGPILSQVLRTEFSTLFITKEQSCPKGYCPIGIMKLYWGRNREQSWNTFTKATHSVQKSITLAFILDSASSPERSRSLNSQHKHDCALAPAGIHRAQLQFKRLGDRQKETVTLPPYSAPMIRWDRKLETPAKLDEPISWGVRTNDLLIWVQSCLQQWHRPCQTRMTLKRPLAFNCAA